MNKYRKSTRIFSTHSKWIQLETKEQKQGCGTGLRELKPQAKQYTLDSMPTNSTAEISMLQVQS